jgi:hypothetical protein
MRTENTYNLGLRYNPSDRTRIGYDLYYDFREEESSFESPRRFSLVSNSLALNRMFSNVFTGSVRLQQSHSNDSLGDAVENTLAYNASLRAAYLPSFTQTLSFVSTRTEQTGESGPVSDTRLGAVTLRNVFQLYSGWNAAIDLGYHRQTDEVIFRRQDTVIARASTGIQPNAKIIFNLSYNGTWSKDSKGGAESRTRTQISNVDVSIVPLKYLSFYANVSVFEQATYGTPTPTHSTKIFQNYSANWSPFPDGGLQFLFGFQETYTTDEDKRERVIGPGLKLEIKPRIYLDASYQIVRSDSITTKIDSNSFSTNFRLIF